ncbi:MAG: ABC transporter ATP-binding protein [Candidatus Acetothermia bacterium]|jgi:branched-chain amino acid transport system ATP-binding protein|nr:ABC transporter ATP-binding protein [Candidatus Acetothermia bacterium]MDH7504714.1 ABC transporter ATP-binding protein [Candidatus Acetothermia bacterium]
MLEVRGLDVYYSKAHVLRGVSLEVEEGEFVAVIGSNGAGKTTLFRSISGLKEYHGQVLFAGEELPQDPAATVARGIIHCPEERHLFPFMSVYDNLMLGAYRRHRDKSVQEDLAMVYGLFPFLKERKRQLARTLSGGEQQMLAIGRALMGRPRLLLLDEPTLGLAPIVRRAISQALEKITKNGMTILLAEQNVVFALEHSSRLYLLETGRIVKEGTVKEFCEDEHVRCAYLGG